MANLNQAPKLLSRGEKKIHSAKGQSWIFDPDLISYIMNECENSCGQLKLMIYLMGNKAGDWNCSTADILQRTGISSKQSLSNIKQALKKRGWIDYNEGDNITVLYDNLYALKGQSQNDPQGSISK